jgi:hypothetical protein
MLFQSLRQLHPEWRLHLALADELRPIVDLAHEPFDQIWTVADLHIPSWRGWAYCHTIVELATAIKPYMLAHLLKQSGCKRVIYLDPDTVVFSRLDDIIDALDDANIVLTPHQTTPEQSVSAVMDNEICSLKHGVYNLGFIGVAATEIGHDFADWWGKRLYHFCRADIPNGLFTDQRWIDLVPAFFSGVAILRSNRYNVAPWNLTTRELSLSALGHYLVDGEPLGFYHFTGFDSGEHRIMADKNSGSNPTVQQLVSWYEKQNESFAQDSFARVPWAYGSYTDGTPISSEQRLVYRERTDLQGAFADPFDATTYLAWWNTQGKIEFPELFNDETRDVAVAKLASNLTPGFRGGLAQFDVKKLGGLLRLSVSNPSAALKIGKRSWEILKAEGAYGLKRRLFT